jgi:hypothetical protein
LERIKAYKKRLETPPDRNNKMGIDKSKVCSVLFAVMTMEKVLKEVCEESECKVVA